VDGLDIKADNIMLGIDDDSVFSNFEEQELLDPSPRKMVGNRAVYLSRELRMPKNWGAPVLCDFGSAVVQDMEHLEDVQPDVIQGTGGGPRGTMVVPDRCMEHGLHGK
jgi:serine/threonine-protein kinase SRPK3